MPSALARSARYAVVASYSSVANYKGKTPDTNTAGRDLNVRYLVEGDIRQDGDRVVVGVRMIDARTARELWNDRLDTTTTQLNTNGVSGVLANRIKGTLYDSEMRRASQADRDRLVREIEYFSLRAVAADRSDPRAWSVRSVALTRQYRWNEALEALDEARRIDPNRTDVYEDRALIMVWMGRPEDAFAELDKAVAVDAREAVNGETMRIGCRAHLALGHYEDAIKLCERASALMNNYTTYIYLSAAYAQRGEMAKASAAKVQLLKLQPGYTIARFRALRMSDTPAYWQQAEAHILSGLRKAGLPEQ